MSGDDTLSLIVGEFGAALAPLETAVSSTAAFSGLLRDLGWTWVGEVPAPIAALVESFAGNCYIINVTFLDRPAATRNGNVYSAADVLARAAESAEAQEPVELRTELTQPTQK